MRFPRRRRRGLGNGRARWVSVQSRRWDERIRGWRAHLASIKRRLGLARSHPLPKAGNRAQPLNYLRVHRAISDATHTLDREELLDRTVDGLQALFPDDFVWIFLLEGDRLRVHRFLAQAPPAGCLDDSMPCPTEPGDELPLDGPGVVAQAARTGQSIRLDDVRQEPGYLPFAREVPIRSELAVPIQSGGEVLGVVNLESTRPFRYTAQDQRELAHVCRHLGTALANLRYRVRERQTLLETITALSSLVEQKDDYTEGHSQRIAEMAVAVGIRMGLSRERLDHLTYAGILHDIGKIAIPDAVLCKQGPLNEEERRIMEEHPRVGAQVLRRIQALQPVADIVEQHHEWWDGSGYPKGLAGEAILLEARILTVVDAFDAMTSTRSYRRALPRAEAIRRLQAGAGTQFDPKVVDVFVRYIAADAGLGAEVAAATGVPAGERGSP